MVRYDIFPAVRFNCSTAYMYLLRLHFLSHITYYYSCTIKTSLTAHQQGNTWVMPIIGGRGDSINNMPTVSAGTVEDDCEWIVQRAKEKLEQNDKYGAHAWILTAKSLFPYRFIVQVSY